MSRFLLFLGCSLLLVQADLLAQSVTTPDAGTSKSNGSKLKYGFESELALGYQLGAKTKVGQDPVGRADAFNQKLSAVVTPQLSDDTTLRVGIEYNRWGFGSTKNIGNFPSFSILNAAPSSLHDLHLVLGADVAVEDEWLIRAEISPGVYTTDWDALQFKSLNAPLIAGAGYLPSKDLQWFFGLLINPRDKKTPAIPAVGVRWHYADDWTLNLLFPSPRLEYQPSKTVKLFLGLQFDGGTYYAPAGAGIIHGKKVGDESVSYSSITAGPGVSWNLLPNAKLEASAGWLVQRRFVYEDSDKQLHANDAPGFSVSFSAQF